MIKVNVIDECSIKPLAVIALSKKAKVSLNRPTIENHRR